MRFLMRGTGTDWMVCDGTKEYYSTCGWITLVPRPANIHDGASDSFRVEMDESLWNESATWLGDVTYVYSFEEALKAAGVKNILDEPDAPLANPHRSE